MADLDPTAAPPRTSDDPLFGAGRTQSAGLPPVVWGVAALIVLLVVAGLVFVGHRKVAPAPTTLQPEDAYAASLPMTNLAMSESESMSGVKVTYLDGHVQNTGPKTVSAITVQVAFANDEALPPQIDTVPLTLIRTRQPYIDTEPVSAEPLKPGDSRDFRLIFESVPANWNTQMPTVRITRTTLH